VKKSNTEKKKGSKINPLTPRQAEKELAALLRLYNADDSILSDVDYERLVQRVKLGLIGRTV